MGELTTAPPGTSGHRPAALEMPSTYLTPTDPFPDALAELELADLHVLHSRITRQLDREYCTDPAGPHPLTADRAQELIAELDTRQLFLAPTATEQSAPLCPCQDQGQPEALSSVGEEPGEAGARIHDLARLRPGEQLQIWQDGRLQGVGTVDEAAPALGVVWIRGALDGDRRLISTQDTELRSHRSHRSHQSE